MQALDGLRVVDMATVFAGPGAAKYLADFGADVVKVEPPSGDGTRDMGWLDPTDGVSLAWKVLGRGKRAVVLDLKTADGLAAMRRLVDTADVLVENLRPGTIERIGLDPDELLARNPGLVVLRVTGFGQTGPYASRPGFATMAEAMGGFAAINGEPDGPPLLPPIALTDEVTALVGAFAVLAAVHHRDRTGAGQVVDVNLLESMLQLMGPLPSVWAELGVLQDRLGSGIPYSVPRGTYRCRDGVWVAVSTSAESVAQRVLGILGAADDPRFADFAGRVEHREELDALLGDWIGARDAPTVLAAFEAADAAIAPMYTMEELLADPHVLARGAVVEVDGVRMPGPVARTCPGRRGASATPDARWAPTPTRCWRRSTAPTGPGVTPARGPPPGATARGAPPGATRPEEGRRREDQASRPRRPRDHDGTWSPNVLLGTRAEHLPPFSPGFPPPERGCPPVRGPVLHRAGTPLHRFSTVPCGEPPGRRRPQVCRVRPRMGIPRRRTSVRDSAATDGERQALMATSEEIAAAVAGHTLATRFRDTVRAHPDRVALRWREGQGDDAVWHELTWAEYGGSARAASPEPCAGWGSCRASASC